ncbi:hypothetical protein H5410_002530 [Solanum commersonii]|uniref:Uncharacterized protein n=1 Tax=Solanum commersonii TaxID=4109 RepID=A0A9J6B214_SOLCO|nr:hypothetical protein H5410_002530 [Solanum commersonii]
MVQQFKAPESNATLTLTKMNTMHDFTYRLPLFSNQQLFQLTQDQKGLFKACNGAECKGVPFFSNHGSKGTFLHFLIHLLFSPHPPS